ncbi:MAG: SRPBCC family protein, partial [Mesorhizobium sp.]
NAVRVVPNGTGAEVMFVLLRMPDMTEEIFAADAAAVERDLNTLKAMLER